MADDTPIADFYEPVEYPPELIAQLTSVSREKHDEVLARLAALEAELAAVKRERDDTAT